MGEERQRFVRMTTLFPQTANDRCRVCDRQLEDARRNYCADYCKTIANNVQRLFTWSFIRDYVATRDGECVRCGKTGHDYQIDHIVPVSKDGHPFDPDNMQRLCTDCHADKGLSSRDYRDDATGGVQLFGAYKNAKLTDDAWNGDAEEVVFKRDF